MRFYVQATIHTVRLTIFTAIFSLYVPFKARRIVDVMNVRAKHYWIDIRTNSTRCLQKIHYWIRAHSITAMLHMLLPFSAFHQIIPVTEAISCFVCPKFNPRMLSA